MPKTKKPFYRQYHTLLSSMIFLFVSGLNSFKDTFRMFLQNGLSRKTLFYSYLYSLLPLCGAMAIIDTSIGSLGRRLSGYHSFFAEFYEQFLTGSNVLLTFIVGLLLSLSIYATCALAGYFITTLYYRMNKGLKLFVSIGVPALFIFVLPMMDVGLTRGAIARGIGELFLLASGVKAGYNPLYPMATCIIFSLALSALSYLLQRRAVIKEQV